jgi:cytochrome c oxidase subunit IV
VRQALVGFLAVVAALVLTKLSQIQEEELAVEDQIILLPLLMLVLEMVLLVDHLQFHEIQ